MDCCMKKIITYGTFDLFHVGHLNIIRRARKMGDYLIVGLSTDRFNLQEKNKQTVISYKDRKHILESLRFVDLVIPEENWNQKIDNVKEFKIDTFVMGHDWSGAFDFLNAYCEVVYLPRTDGISSTELKAHIELNGNVAFNKIKPEIFEITNI